MTKFILGNAAFIKLLQGIDAHSPYGWLTINRYLQEGLIVDHTFDMNNPFHDQTLMEKLLYTGWKNGSSPLVIRFAKFIDWDGMLTYMYLSGQMVRIFPDMVNWSLIFDNNYWSEEIHYEFEDRLQFDRICWTHKSEVFLCRYAKYVDWTRVEWYNRSGEFITQFADHVNWIEVDWEDRSVWFLDNFSQHVIWSDVWFDVMPEWFIKKYQRHITRLQWSDIGDTERSEQFLTEFQNKLTTEQLLDQPECPLSIYETYPDKVKWYHISGFRSLSEWFIIKYADKLNWKRISAYQKLSFDTVQRFESRINFYQLSTSKWLTYEMVKKYRPRMQCVRNVKKVIKLEHTRMYITCKVKEDAIATEILSYL